MAGHDLTPGRDPAVHKAIEEYLAALGALLPAGRRARNAVVDELRDGLREATARHGARGLPPVAAARAAVVEFGPAAVVASAYGGELATARVRRTLRTLLATGPLVGIWWLVTLAPRPWARDPAAVLAAIPALPLVAVVVLGALATLAATGTGTRWLPALPPARAVHAATVLVGACVAADVSVLTALAARAVGAQPLPWTLATVAVAASLLRIGSGGYAVRRLARSRAALR